MGNTSEKKYVSDSPELMREWDFEKNITIGLDPQNLSVGSQKIAFWICAKHKTKFKQIIRARERGQRGCSVCLQEHQSLINRERSIEGKKPLAETHPNLLLEWVECKNPQITPYNCVAGSQIKVKWKCQKCFGEYEAYIKNRALNGSSCPYCANQKVLKGYNDLQSKFPALAKEWSSKNTLLPTQITPHSHKKVYWICKFGHDDYLMSVGQRSRGQGCPVCATQSQTSFPEQAIYFYIKQVFPDAINRYKYNSREIDIFIPSQKTGIEYNGYFSHKDKSEKDAEKKKYLNSVGIKLIVVKEYKNKLEKKDADFYINERVIYTDLTDFIKQLLFSLCRHTVVDVDCFRDSIMIKEQYYIQRKERSIANIRPDLIIEWDYVKNGKITPELVSIGSNMKYYWICPVCANSYEATPKSRSHGTGCPICSSKIVKTGTNDLKSVYPELLKEWDYEKNSQNPSFILAGGETEYYWKCKLEHSYLSSIRNKVKGYGCPICAGKQVLAGFNDLLSVKPQMATEWDYELNECKPDEIHHNNQSKQIHWVCSVCGNKWISKVSNRINCPECEKKKKQINVYYANDLSFYNSFEDAKSLCEHFALNYKNQRGNISSVCHRKQKTLMGQYILRHANDDEYAKN